MSESSPAFRQVTRTARNEQNAASVITSSGPELIISTRLAFGVETQVIISSAASAQKQPMQQRPFQMTQKISPALQRSETVLQVRFVRNSRGKSLSAFLQKICKSHPKRFDMYLAMGSLRNEHHPDISRRVHSVARLFYIVLARGWPHKE